MGKAPAQFSALLGVAGAETPEGQEAIGSTLNLFRAVQDAELENISSTNAFTNPAGIETKYFSTTLAGASSFAQRAGTAFGEVYTIVQTSMPASGLSTADQLTVDGGIPTLTLPTSSLPILGTPQVLGYIPFVPRVR